MMKEDAILRTKLEGKELSAYEKMKKEVEKSKVKDGNSFSNFVSLLKSFRAEQQSYLSLLECRTIAQGKQHQVETNNAEILALSAPLKDVAKVYAGNVKSFSSVRPSLGSMEDVKATIVNYTQILEQQSAMLGYLRQRKQVVDLDSKILSSLAASKKCTKAYQTLLKSLPLDEQSVAGTVDVLKTLSAKVATIDVTSVESSLKNAKTPEQIKAAFGI